MSITELLVYGRHRETGKMIFIDHAVNGKDCNCVCTGCGVTLIARQGQHNTSHFAHANGGQCAYAVESAIHQLAKEIIAENSFMRLPDNVLFSYSESAIEKKVCDYRPDAILKNGTGVLHVEIFVTHKIGFNKRKFLIDQGLQTVEIDLSDLPRSISKNELQQIIIEEIFRKKYIREESEISLLNPAIREIVFTEAVFKEARFDDAVFNETFFEDAVIEEAMIGEAIVEEAHVERHTPWYLKVIGVGIIILLAGWFIQSIIPRSRY